MQNAECGVRIIAYSVLRNRIVVGRPFCILHSIDPARYTDCIIECKIHQVDEMKFSLPIQRDGNARKDPGLASDCELAARIKEGDREALRRLVERHIGRLHSYLLHRVGDGHDELIDRVVAATFSDALRRITPYAKGTASTPMNLWLIRLAERNLARTRSASPFTVDAPPSDLTRLRAAMSALPNRHKFVLSLAVFEQMPPGDIAAALGTSPSGAMRRLRTALNRVGQVLAKQEGGED